MVRYRMPPSVRVVRAGVTCGIASKLLRTNICVFWLGRLVLLGRVEGVEMGAAAELKK